MNSDERRAARRKRREERRVAKRAERLEIVTMEQVASIDSLYKAQRSASRGVSWKASVQRYQRNALQNVAKLRHDLLTGAEICRGVTRFCLYERGKLRQISSVHFSERVAHKSLSQNALMPAIEPTMVSGASANRRGRGTDYAVTLLKMQLAAHYRRHGSEGYILQIDFRDYFATIDHGPVKAQLASAMDDGRLVALAQHLVDSQGEVGLGLGSEPNQVCAIAHPSRIDHFITEMCGVEAYGRYMDDSYCIHTDKAYLRIVLALVADRCAELGITLHPTKTRIVKLSRGFTFLKKRFSYGPTGKVVVRPCRESITRERRKLKRLAAIYRAGEMTLEQVEQSYQSWRGSMLRYDAHRAVLAMDALYRELFLNDLAGGGGSGQPS